MSVSGGLAALESEAVILIRKTVAETVAGAAGAIEQVTLKRRAGYVSGRPGRLGDDGPLETRNWRGYV